MCFIQSNSFKIIEIAVICELNFVIIFNFFSISTIFEPKEKLEGSEIVPIELLEIYGFSAIRIHLYR